jgi:hypothetical protein
MPFPYDWLHRYYANASGTTTFITTDSGDVVLKAAKSSAYTIYVKRLTVTIKTSAAQTITFQDTTAVTPIYVEKTDSAPGDNTVYSWEFPGKGVALGAGKNFIMTFSAAGLAGHVQWEAYQKSSSQL